MWWHRVRPAAGLSTARARTPRRSPPRLDGRALPRPVYLDGHLSGDIVTTEPVIVGEAAVIRANIRAPSVVIMGEVLGDVTATDSIELRFPAKMTGDITAPQVVIEPGTSYIGMCRMAL